MNQYDVMGSVDIFGETEYQGYAAPQVFTGARSPRGMVISQPHTGGTLDDLKAWLDKKSVANIPNKYLVAGVAAAGLLYYGHSEGWF